MYIWGGTSALPMAEAAENDPNNTVGQVITVGGSLTGGDIFNFTSENTANSTALRFYGENLDIPMTGSGVYTINGNGGIISQAYGMFSAAVKMLRPEAGVAHPKVL